MVKEQKVLQIRKTKYEIVQHLAKNLQISPTISQILVNRDIFSVKEAGAFFHDNLASLEDPYQLPDMNKAVERILLSLKNKENILIYGDYDVDGISSIALLTCFLKKQGALTHYYIPERLEEGYGLNKGALMWAKKELNCNLVITVDCGINALEEVKEAASLGLDIIITDHHEPGSEKPPAIAVVNPKLKPTNRSRHLAGVGVAFKLAQAIAIRLNLPKVNNTHAGDLLDLTVLGTIADVVPLVEENRIIVKYGLPILNELKRPGLKALVEVAGLAKKNLTTRHIAFGLAPRINAVGRLGSASPAVELLLTESDQKACELAAKLSKKNTERQLVETQIFNDVCQRIENEVDLSREKVIVLASEVWHSGVIGIVASKVVERYYRPILLLAIEGDYAKGSGRSIKYFDLFTALQNCEEVIVKYGGHQYAVGLTVKTEDIGKLKELINQYADVILTPTLLTPSQDIDLEMNLSDLNPSFFQELKKLEPFGVGNPEPLFYSRKMKIHDYKEVGKQFSHLKCKVGYKKFFLDAIGFNLAFLIKEKIIEPEKEVDIVYNLHENDWNGEKTLQLNIKDIYYKTPFMEFFKLNMKYISFLESISNEVDYIIKVPLRRIENYLYFSLTEMLSFKEIEVLRLDGQLNLQMSSDNNKRLIIATDAFLNKHMTYAQKNKCKIINYHDLFHSFKSCEDIIDLREAAKDIILDKLISQGKRLFIICNYKKQAIALAEQLISKFSNIDDNNLKLVFNTQDLEDLILTYEKIEIVISNQLLEFYTWLEYDVKVIYQAPFSIEELCIRTIENKGKQVVLLWNKADLTINSEMLKAIFPDKYFLKKLFNYLEKCPKDKPLELESMIYTLESLEKSNLRISIAAGLKVFEEIGIVIKHGGNYFPMIEQKTINLKESACFLEGVQEKEAFKQLLISALPWEVKTEVI